jgi:hypothetical protein
MVCESYQHSGIVEITSQEVRIFPQAGLYGIIYNSRAGHVKEVDMYLLIIVTSFLIISWFSMLAGKAEERIWVKSRVSPSRLEMQQRINQGKAQDR